MPGNGLPGKSSHAAGLVALTYIYGIGDTFSNKILATTGVSPDTRVKDLTEGEITKLRELIGGTTASKAISRCYRSTPTFAA